MNFKIMTLAVVLSFSLVGCNYFEDKLVEKARNELKATQDFGLSNAKQSELDTLKQMGIHVDVANQYPTFVWTLKFTTLNKDEIPANDLAQFSTQMNNELCQAVGGFDKGTAKERKIMARVLEEDRVVMKFVLKDKIGRELGMSSKVVSDCPEFSALKSAS